MVIVLPEILVVELLDVPSLLIPPVDFVVRFPLGVMHVLSPRRLYLSI